MKAIITIIILSLIISFPHTSSPQNAHANTIKYCVIRGYVYDSVSRIRLQGATIMIKGYIAAVVSNSSGYFKLKLPNEYLEKHFSILIMDAGYTTAIIDIQNKKGFLNKNLAIYLHQNKSTIVN